MNIARLLRLHAGRLDDRAVAAMPSLISALKIRRAAAAFELAACALGVQLKIVRDGFEEGRKAYEARFILIPPDRYVVSTGAKRRTTHRR